MVHPTEVEFTCDLLVFGLLHAPALTLALTLTPFGLLRAPTPCPLKQCKQSCTGSGDDEQCTTTCHFDYVKGMQ